MLKRTITGAAIVAVTVAFFFLREVDVRFFLIYTAAISLVGSFEINRALKDKTCFLQKALCFASVAAANVANVFFGLTGMLVCYLTFGIALLVVFVFYKPEISLESLGCSFFAIIYPAVMLIPLTLMNALGKVSFFALVLTFIISPCADVFAYLVGRTFKGKKLCPSVSPNKTISGAIGGLLGGIGGSIAVYAVLKGSFTYHLNTNPYVYFAVVGLVAALLTEVGDLAESAIKRRLEIKDSGKIFPGHGGMLDRVDGLIFASTFIFFVTALF